MRYNHSTIFPVNDKVPQSVAKLCGSARLHTLLLTATCLLLFLSQAWSNSYAITLLTELPKGESVRNIETELPSTGKQQRLSLDELKKFLNQGRRLSVVDWGQIPTRHPEIWKEVSDKIAERSNSLPEGAFVDARFKIYHWKRICPNLLQITEFGGLRTAFLYLEGASNHSGALTTTPPSPQLYNLHQGRQEGTSASEQEISIPTK